MLQAMLKDKAKLHRMLLLYISCSYFYLPQMSLEELEQEVAEKLARVESCISKVEEVHHNLQENARKVRLGIMCDIQYACTVF